MDVTGDIQGPGEDMRIEARLKLWLTLRFLPQLQGQAVSHCLSRT